MTSPLVHQPDPRLDLQLERVVDLPPALVWAAWTRPEHMKVWFTPAPWRTLDAEIDLRPGGIFRTVMQGPDTPPFENTGCILEVVPDRKLAWTGALGPGYRPRPADFAAPFLMSAVISLEEAGPGRTKYTALVVHGDEASQERHAAMGFREGWGKALDQLVAHMKSVA